MSDIESINYMLRPSKNIERKLIFEAIGEFSDLVQFPQYRYLGFGSMWFADFVLAHRVLRIEDMLSVEHKAWWGPRAEFNKPYRCVSVQLEEATKVLGELDWKEKRAVVWLDYTDSIAGPALTDSRIVCERAAANSFLVVTLNAYRGTITAGGGVDDRAEMKKNLKHYLGNLVPADLPNSALSAIGYPKFLLTALRQHLERSVRRSGRDERFRTLFSYVYQDGAPMITVGGIIGNCDIADRVARIVKQNEHVTGEEPYEIQAPPLTSRERVALDQMLPGSLTLEAVQKAGFVLKKKQLKSYERLYRYYPEFAEVSR